jgi:hypothetical protein
VHLPNDSAFDRALNARPGGGARMTVLQTAFLLGGDLPVSRLGFGAMRLTGQPGNFGPYADWEAGTALLRRAVELGVTFFDTA